VLLNGARDLSDTCIVLRSEHVVTALQGFGKTLRRGSNDEILGRGWPLFFRVLAHLGYPNNPRDRFMEKIDLTLRLAQITNNLLYQGVSHGRLVPNQAGELYHLALSQRDGIALQDLIDKNPWLRLLNDLRFLLDERRQHDLLDLARTLVREYLDTSYLRLSLAGIMPDVAAAMAAMPYRENGSSFLTPQPAIGAYGILDDSDLKAWRKVDRPFRDMGYTILRQLGIGEFGRVYEALNAANPTFPLRVALKVDRIRPGEKKQMIQQADVVMQIGRDLAPAPHVIRIYDAGKLRKKKYTFHVLQVVDGDTLDNLLGIAGKEHSSVHRPIDPWQSATDVQVQYLQAVSGSAGESWRRRRMVHSFLEAPTLPQMLDLLTSVLLWIEEIHKLDYAINDLKNGNLMLSRRGQLKGIDLDSYSPVHTPIDRITDFYFLAVSLSLFLLNITGNVRGSQIVEDQLVRDADKLRESLQQAWPFGEIAERCEGRVRTDDVLDFLLQVVTRCRDRTYAEHTWQLSHDIDELIHLKRTIFAEELVLD
jgi:hypothetical protein